MRAGSTSQRAVTATGLVHARQMQHSDQPPRAPMARPRESAAASLIQSDLPTPASTPALDAVCWMTRRTAPNPGNGLHGRAAEPLADGRCRCALEARRACPSSISLASLARAADRAPVRTEQSSPAQPPLKLWLACLAAPTRC